MNVEEIFEALSEGRISFNEAVQLLMQAGFSGELRSVPMIVRRERIIQRPCFGASPQERKVIVGKVIDQREKEKREIPYCDICKVYYADANRDLQMLVGKKLCSECVRKVIEDLMLQQEHSPQKENSEPTIREMNAEFVKTEKPIEIRKGKKEETKNDQ
jgi:ribosomal protein L34E